MSTTSSTPPELPGLNWQDDSTANVVKPWLQLGGLSREHLVSVYIHYADPLSPYSLDHSFTRQNISMVTATLDNHQLAYDILYVPSSIQAEISSTSADFREGVIEYYAQYSPRATWGELAGLLYDKECHEALARVKRLIKRTPGNQ